MDDQFFTVQEAIKDGRIHSLGNLLKYFSEAELMGLLGVPKERLDMLIKDPELMTVKEPDLLADVFKTDIYKLMDVLRGK
ncbi:MAG TPA: hypothetical protein VHC48_19580 [Puia sp.]|nr:hypothetical protein [Puia sp.]